MKKYFIGGLIGFALAFTVTVHAEVVNMIGKVIDGELNVTVNGNKLDSQAITIEGTSYLPVRAIGTALGLKISYDPSSGVSLNQPSTAIEEQTTALGKKAKDLFEERRVLSDKGINSYEVPTGKDQNGRDVYKEKDDAYYAAKKKYDEISAELNDISKQIDDLVQQK